MASIARGSDKPVKPLVADAYEKVLAFAATALFGAVLVALAKGRAQWPAVPLVVWGHLVTVMLALALTPVMLLRRRGDASHRLLGKIWVMAMFLTALESFFVRLSHHGGFSFIHIISAYVVIAAPMIWWTAHSYRVGAHRGRCAAW